MRNTLPLTPPSGLSTASRGWLLGALGVAIFALSIPMTRLAGGSVADPQLPPAFVAIGRAALAGLLSLAWLLAVRAPRPARAQWPALAVGSAGVVFGWPLFLGFAVREVDAVHAAMVSGLLPIATATLAALWLRQRPGWRFWACALAGTGLVLGYIAWRGAAHWQGADGLLVAAVLCSAAGYVAGASLSAPGSGRAAMPAEQVICWILVVSLPLTLPLTWWVWPAAPARAAAWGGFLYVSVFSMWLGFFAWYRGLALGGAVRVSQVQLLQPFASMLLAVPLLGERLDAGTAGFALAVMACVLAARLSSRRAA